MYLECSQLCKRFIHLKATGTTKLDLCSLINLSHVVQPSECHTENGDEANDNCSPMRDIEDIGGKTSNPLAGKPVAVKRKHDQGNMDSFVSGGNSQSQSCKQGNPEVRLNQSWRDVLGSPPPVGETKVSNYLF